MNIKLMRLTKETLLLLLKSQQIIRLFFAFENQFLTKTKIVLNKVPDCTCYT